jgi:parallel beta-helix repeat protein
MNKPILVLTCLLLAIPCQARIITVDNDGPADFNNIQAAIDDSNNDDTIIVADGVYKGLGNRDIDFKGKAIVVHSENGPQNCIIDCGKKSNHYQPYGNAGFIFNSEENPDSVLNGFTIINGSNGAIFCGRYGGTSSPTIINCIIKNNCGGIICLYSSNPIIANCIIAGNTLLFWRGGYFVGGIDCYANSSPKVNNCTIVGNSGGGISCRGYLSGSNPIITNSIIWDNSPKQIGVYNNMPIIVYNDIQGGWQDNMSIDPCFVEPGCWEDPCNTPYEWEDDVWRDGNYHLKSQAGRWDTNEGRWTKDEVTSLCIDAGDPASPIGLEPFPNGGIINMGAYGGTIEASKSYFGEPVCETIVAGDINGDCKVDFKDFAFMAFHWLEDNNP